MQKNKNTKKANMIIDLFIGAFWPLFFVLLVLVVDFLLGEFFAQEQIYIKLASFINHIKFLTFVGLGVWCCLNSLSFLNLYFKKSFSGYKVDHVVVLSSLKFFVIASAALMVLQNFGAQITSVLAFGGLGGVIAGLAAREFLANMFGFVGIIMDRTFKVGDTISSPDKKISGVVEDIGLRCTKIITDDQKLIYVPNSFFSTIIVQNETKNSVWHFKEKIFVVHLNRAVLLSIVANIKEFFIKADFIKKELDATCSVVGLGTQISSILLSVFVDAFKESEYLELKEEILFAVSDIVCKIGGRILLCDPSIKLLEELDDVANDLSKNFEV